VILKKLFISSRPISWINTAFPFAVAYYLGTSELDLAFFIGTFFFLIPYNLLMYGVNDVYDYESDLRNPRKGGIEGGLLAPKYHKATLYWAYLLALPFAVALTVLKPSAWLVLWFTLFMVIAYSHKASRFKEIPVLDSITSSLHFVGPLVIGLSMGGIPIDTRGLAAALIAFFLWGMASHAFGAVQDVKADREAGIHSIATKFGARITTRLALVGYLLAGISALTLPDRFAFATLAAIPYLLVLGREFYITDETCEIAHRGWRVFIWLNFFAGALVSALLIGPS
jgi:4-hydroxybenzoate polyprenyltransferase